MTPERVINLLESISYSQHDPEKREACEKAIEVLKYVERVKAQLERDLERRMRNE